VVGGGGGVQVWSSSGLTHTGNAPDGSLGFGGDSPFGGSLGELGELTALLVITPPMPPTISKTMSFSILR